MSGRDGCRIPLPWSGKRTRIWLRPRPIRPGCPSPFEFGEARRRPSGNGRRWLDPRAFTARRSRCDAGRALGCRRPDPGTCRRQPFLHFSNSGGARSWWNFGPQLAPAPPRARVDFSRAGRVRWVGGRTAAESRGVAGLGRRVSLDLTVWYAAGTPSSRASLITHHQARRERPRFAQIAGQSGEFCSASRPAITDHSNGFETRATVSEPRSARAWLSMMAELRNMRRKRQNLREIAMSAVCLPREGARIAFDSAAKHEGDEHRGQPTGSGCRRCRPPNRAPASHATPSTTRVWMIVKHRLVQHVGDDQAGPREVG